MTDTTGRAPLTPHEIQRIPMEKLMGPLTPEQRMQKSLEENNDLLQVLADIGHTVVSHLEAMRRLMEFPIVKEAEKLTRPPTMETYARQNLQGQPQQPKGKRR